MTSATIKLFLPRGDAKSLRTAEISNWTGKAVAAPRTELDELLARDELEKSGVYILIGSDPFTNAARAYIGEEEVIRERLKHTRLRSSGSRPSCLSARMRTSLRHMCGILRAASSPRPPGSAGSLSNRIRLAAPNFPNLTARTWRSFWRAFGSSFPSLGSDILSPIAQPTANAQPGGVLFCRIKGAETRGQRTANGFVIFHGSTAVLEERPSAESYPSTLAQRKQFIADGTLIEKDGVLVFTKDAECASPSAAAVVIHGGSANGLAVWKTKDGKSLKHSTNNLSLAVSEQWGQPIFLTASGC